jgi:hypothetical protein
MTKKIVRFLSSRWFFIGVMIFFAIEALWVAFSAVYPMAFDEDFHFGIIKIYSDHLTPFLTTQPEGGDSFGALATDPSYLYHYLMSWPYRLIATFTDSVTAQVIFLRLINIALFGAGIVLFRKVMFKAGSSAALANTAIALFVLIPIVPLLSGQINYDNLLMPLVAGLCLLVFKVIESLREQRVDLKSFGLLIILMALTSLIKYPFLPIALATAIFLAVYAWISLKKRKPRFTPLTLVWKIGLLSGLVLAGGLFLQRYGANLVRYHDPVPDCAAVIGQEACINYGPWARNLNYAKNPIEFDKSPLVYTWTWLQALHYRLFFMITGPPKHTNYPPAPLPSAVAVIIGVVGVVALVFYRKRVFAGRPFLGFLLFMSLFYVAVLFFENYSQYLETGRPVAINGRYLIPIFLPLAAVFGRALSIALFPWPKIKAWAAAVAIFMFIQGGGIFSFILRSDSTWYWSNQTVVDINETAQTVLDPVILQGPKHY